MVKVCNFSFFDIQRILTPKSGEPLAIACSNEHLFVAEEGCVLEVYRLSSTDPMAQLRTVSPVVQLVYNPCGDCIVTLERKNATSRMFARVYFKWQESSIDRPMRISLIASLTGGLLSGGGAPTAEIVELPADETSVSCVAVCKESGRIAVGMDSRVRVFALRAEYEGGRVQSHSIEILLDVETSVCVKRVDVFNDYLAYISTCEARVLKLSLFHEAMPPTVPESEVSSSTTGWESDRTTPTLPRPPKVQLIDRNKESGIQTDESFVCWSPSKVWEDEQLSANSSLNASTNQSNELEPHPLYDRVPLPRGPSSHIETLALPAITMATQERTVEKHAVEVCGPVEYVWGQPVEVSMEEATPTTRCRVLTMLYRRFPVTRDLLSGVRRAGAETTSLPPQSGRSQEGEGVGLHTVELVPVRLDDSHAVIGVSCFIGSRLHGYLYDVANKTRLISSFSFMSDTRGVASDGYLFHAVSQNSVETFSNRAMQVAVFNRPSTDSEHSKWLRQPCPSPNMDLTLMASNKLIGGCCLATSRDYLVVLTKSDDPQVSPSKGLLQSLRRPPAEPTWNIYILLKRDPLLLYQQFVEYGKDIRGTSPPMYQHVISEGHVLLRSQLLLNSALSPSVKAELTKMLCENCFSLADSLCTDSRGSKVVSSIAAKYFILSGVPINRVVQHIRSTYPQTKGLPYQVLLKYLSLVVMNEGVKGQLEPVAHTILDLFAQYKSSQLSHVLLASPLGQLAPDHGLVLLSDQLQKGPKSQDRFKGQLCQVMLMLRLGREEEAKEVIGQLPEDSLLNWLKDNMATVVDTSTVALTPLGKLLWTQCEGCLLKLIHQMLATAHVSLDNALSMLQVKGKGLADNTLLKGLLEKIVLGKEQDHFRLPAAFHLVDLLLARLVSAHSPRPPSSTPFSLYGNRHKWLDSLPPFDGTGSTLSQPPTQTVLQDLMQLQALLCSSELLHVAKLAGHTHSRLEEQRQEVLGGMSLKLLIWPHIGRTKEAVVLALECAPLVTVEFCLTYLPQELGSWRDLLSLLLEQVLRTPNTLVHVHRTLYKSALEHVVTMTTPEEFLGLLPPSGALEFFLPFIENSVQHYVARQLAAQLNSTSSVR